MKNLPEQECLGSFCPVFSNLVVRKCTIPVIVGRVRRIRSFGLPANAFTNFERTLRLKTTKKNGIKIRKVVNLEMLR